jgi:hypothetical protein
LPNNPYIATDFTSGNYNPLAIAGLEGNEE